MYNTQITDHPAINPNASSLLARRLFTPTTFQCQSYKHVCPDVCIPAESWLTASGLNRAVDGSRRPVLRLQSARAVGF